MAYEINIKQNFTKNILKLLSTSKKNDHLKYLLVISDYNRSK